MKILEVWVISKYFSLPTAELRCSFRKEKEYIKKKYFKLGSQEGLAQSMCTLIPTCLYFPTQDGITSVEPAGSDADDALLPSRPLCWLDGDGKQKERGREMTARN